VIYCCGRACFNLILYIRGILSKFRRRCFLSHASAAVPSLQRPSLKFSSWLSGTAANLWTLISLSTTFEIGSRHVGLGTHRGVLGCGCGSGQTSEGACIHSHASAAAFLCRALRPMFLAICEGFLCILGFNQPVDHLCDWRPVFWILRPALRDELAQRLTDVARQRPSVPACHLDITY